MARYEDSWAGLSPGETARAVACFQARAQADLGGNNRAAPREPWLALSSVLELLPGAHARGCLRFLGCQPEEEVCLADWCAWLTEV